MIEDMIEKVEDTFEGVSKKAKKIDKKKVFLVMCIGVGVIALVMWYRRKSQESGEEYATVIAGDGYSGMYYGAGAGGGNSGSDSFDSLVDEYNGILGDLEQQYGNELSRLEQDYQAQLGTLNDQYSAQLKESEIYYADQLAIFDENIKQIEAEKEALKNSLGSYDSSLNYTQLIRDTMAAGNKGNSDTVSDLLISQATKIAAGDTQHDSSKYLAEYEKDVDYMAAINRARENGASQEVIDVLIAKREAKIKGEKLTKYMNTGNSKATATSTPVQGSAAYKAVAGISGVGGGNSPGHTTKKVKPSDGSGSSGGSSGGSGGSSNPNVGTLSGVASGIMSGVSNALNNLK